MRCVPMRCVLVLRARCRRMGGGRYGVGEVGLRDCFNAAARIASQYSLAVPDPPQETGGGEKPRGQVESFFSAS